MASEIRIGRNKMLALSKSYFINFHFTRAEQFFNNSVVVQRLRASTFTPMVPSLNSIEGLLFFLPVLSNFPNFKGKLPLWAKLGDRVAFSV